MAAEALDAPLIQSEAEMSAMRYAYKAGWIETPEKSETVTRERAADVLVIASGNVIWPQDAAPFADESGHFRQLRRRRILCCKARLW